VPPGAASSQTAWRVSRTARRTAPQILSLLQVPPGGITPTTKRLRDSDFLLGVNHLAPQALPPGAALTGTHCLPSIAWWIRSLPPGAIPVQPSPLVYVLYLKFLPQDY